jgi:hypothetical protein
MNNVVLIGLTLPRVTSVTKIAHHLINHSTVTVYDSAVPSDKILAIYTGMPMHFLTCKLMSVGDTVQNPPPVIAFGATMFITFETNSDPQVRVGFEAVYNTSELWIQKA